MAHSHQMEHVQTKEIKSVDTHTHTPKTVRQKRQWMLRKCQGAFTMQELEGEFARMHHSTHRKHTDPVHPDWGTCTREYKETKHRHCVQGVIMKPSLIEVSEGETGTGKTHNVLKGVVRRPAAGQGPHP